MKSVLLILFAAILMTSCSTATKNNPSTGALAKDTTPKVIGIGGIFFKSSDPASTTDWYSKNLGLTSAPYGVVFEFRNSNRPDEINYLCWSAFKKETNYFKPSEKEFMINYRVQNIEGLLRNLRKSGATIVDTIQKVDYGKFVHIMDPDGNKIELWEPIDSVLTKMGGKTNK
ncbi:MAG: Glyoxalase-like domain protein [Bacteroidetes bacterium]|nr:Glyoxalase-like domain protein [Bacteroidota bacterium]